MNAKPSVSSLRASAREVLSRGRNRLLLIEGWIVLIFSASLCFLLRDSVSLALVAMGKDLAARFFAELFSFVLFSAYTGLFLFPLLFGLFGMAERMVRGEECTLFDLFSPFESKRNYVRAMLGTYRIFFVGISLIALLYLAELFFWSDPYAPLIFSFPVYLYPVAFLLCAPVYPAVSFAYASLGECRASIGYMKRGLSFFFGYLPWILLGFLTVGVLLLIDVLPSMLCAYALDCGSVTVRTNDDISESLLSPDK